MKNSIQVRRVAGGPDVGKLRVIVDVTIDTWEERAIAGKIGVDKIAGANLRQKPTRRGVGPVAEHVAGAMVDAVLDLGGK